MNRETTFWSVVTALALAAILVLYAQDAGLFEREKAPNDTIDVDTSSDEIEESVDEPVDEPGDEPVAEPMMILPTRLPMKRLTPMKVKPQQQILPTLSP